MEQGKWTHIMSAEEIINIATKYLDDKKVTSPFNKCYSVSYGLSLLLSEMGIDNKLVLVEVDSSMYLGEGDFEAIEHFFIKIGSKILDVTASQFKGMPRVYYGSRPIWYK